jgi:hypothetical protein
VNGHDVTTAIAELDKALWAVVMEAYVAGVSTRKVDDPPTSFATPPT